MKPIQDFLTGFRGANAVCSALKPRSVLSSAALVALSLLAATSVAHAAPVSPIYSNSFLEIYQDGFPSGLDEQKIFLNKNDNPATTATGQVGSQTGTSTVDFLSTTPVIAENGFAAIKNTTVDKVDVLYHDLSITVPGYTFTDLIFNTQKADDVTINVFSGITLLGTKTVTGLGNGLVGFLALAVGDTTFTRVLLTSADGFFETKQFQISGLEPIPGPGPGPAPLPPAGILFLSVLGLAGFWARMRKSDRLPNGPLA